MNNMQRFARKNHNHNNNNNNTGSSFNSNRNNNNLFQGRLGDNSSNTGRFQRKNNFESGNWKTRDARNTRRPPNNQRLNHRNNRTWSNNRQFEAQSNVERWYKITVPFASKLEPFFVVTAIQQQGIEFVPFNYTLNGNAAVFYVQGEEICYSIKGLSRRITTPEGLKLIFQTEKSTLPLIDITPEFVDKLKLVMSKRYDVNNKCLNLSHFSSEVDFLSIRLYVSLQRINVCKEVVDIIIGNIPDLVSLNLSNNKIQNMEVFKPLVSVCKCLKKLDLSHNNINNIDHLDHLKGLDLETLSIDFNPFKKNIKDRSQENFIRLIRARFPKVVNLDSISIPPPICFDIDDESTTIPETKDGFIPDHLKDFVQNFVKKYFELFDSDNRQQLLDTYYEQANFSYSINRVDNRAKEKAFDMSMLSESRNLLRISENQKEKLLRRGRACVVTALSNFPTTEHILQSFKIDVPIYADHYIVVNINGLFKTKRPYNLKTFTRNFLIVSHKNTFAIVNDLLSITSPSVENINFAKNLMKNDPNSQDMNFMDSMDEMDVNRHNQMNQFNVTKQVNTINQISNPTGLNSTDFTSPSTSVMNSNQMNLLNNNLIPSTHQSVISSTALNQPSFNTTNQIVSSPLNSQHEELINQFAQITGMNRDFSQKCLLENNYNADKALNIFKVLNEKNLIPAEAFNK